jgi:hypothetical protein
MVVPGEEGSVTPEHGRLREAREAGVPWRKWGPYLSERQWGTVREDCSAGGDAWNDFPHDHARSRAYRWGEDGIGGFCDEQMRLCFGLALWNGRDPVLKERLFGLDTGVFEGTTKFQDDPHWRDLILFYEYFHGDNGAGLGASHQTGWTGLVSALAWLYGSMTAEEFLHEGGAAFDRLARVHEGGVTAAPSGA